MSEEETADDWFERAIDGDDPPFDEDEGEDGADGDGDDWFTAAVGAEGADDPDDGNDSAVAGVSDTSTAEHAGTGDEETEFDDIGSGDGPGIDAAPGFASESPEEETADADEPDADGLAASDDDAGDDGTLFEEDFASALDGAPDIQGGGGVGDAAGGVGGGGGGAGGFGTGDAGGEFDMATDDGFGMGDAGDDFGMGGGFGGEEFQEADEAVDSDIDRINLGIEGLDEMIQSGVPRRSLMVAIGSAGTGKTTFGLQFLNEGLEDGDRAIFIALEESRDRIVNSATEKGMRFDDHVENGDLAIVDLDPIEMANSLSSIRSELPHLIDEFGATRLVLDSVSLLEMMYDDRAQRRNEIFDFTQSLKRAGVTTMLTSEASADSPYNSRHGIVEYLTDAVFVLQYVRPSDFRETRLAVEIQKIRDANHSRETKPYEITDQGISVYRQANIF